MNNAPFSSVLNNQPKLSKKKVDPSVSDRRTNCDLHLNNVLEYYNKKYTGNAEVVTEIRVVSDPPKETVFSSEPLPLPQKLLDRSEKKGKSIHTGKAKEFFSGGETTGSGLKRKPFKDQKRKRKQDRTVTTNQYYDGLYN